MQKVKVKFNLEKLRDQGLQVADFEEAIERLVENLEYLQAHNKNYNQNQYWKIVECLMIVDKIEIK